MANNTKAKTKAWDSFAKFIRIRDCLETTGLVFVGKCFTCERRFHISMLDAGHFNSGRRNSVLFDEQGVHAQCTFYCNRLNHGETKKYRKMLIKYYPDGLEVVERLERQKKQVVQDKDMDFEGIEKKYKLKLEKLLRDNGYKTWSELLKETLE